MPTIELFESTGSPEAQEVTTNKNLKSTGSPTSSAEYYLYPIRRPEGSTLLSNSFTNNLYAKVSGTYSKITRPRWKIDVPDTTSDNVRLFYAMRDQYFQPMSGYDGSLTHLNNTVKYLFPRTGNTSPSTTTEYKYEHTANQTIYTDYLVMQLLVEPSAEDDVGNIEPIKITFEFDLYE